ncbi:MAG: hypothetical protein ACP6IP_10865 [Candidatus Njordarchaeia archaeon]
MDIWLEVEKELAKEEVREIEKHGLEYLFNRLFDSEERLYALAFAMEDLKNDGKDFYEVEQSIIDTNPEYLNYKIIAEAMHSADNPQDSRFSRIKRTLKSIGKIALVSLLIGSTVYASGCLANDHSNTTTTSTAIEQPSVNSININSPLPGEQLIIDVSANADLVKAEIGFNSVLKNYTLTKQNGLFELRLDTREGIYNIEKIYACLADECTSKEIDEQVEVFDNPEIILDNITKYQNNGSVLVKARIKDGSGVNEAYLIYDNSTITLNKTNGYYQAGFSLINPEDASKIRFTIIASDVFNNTAKKNFEIDWDLRDGYIYFVNKNNFNKSLALQLFDNRAILQNIYASDKNLTKEILFIANNSNKDLQENIAFLALNYTDSEQEAKLYFDILYNTQTYQANKELIKALDYYVDAILKQNLPEHDYSILKLFIDASNKNPELVDFEPIIVKDNYGHRVIIDSYNKPRDTWMIVEFIKRNPYVANNDNLYLPVNMMIKEMAWNFFDNKFGPRYADKHHNDLSDEELNKIYQPTNEDIWYIIQKLWDYYYNGIGKRYQYVKWWDKQEFAKQYPSELERKLILIGLWDLPNQVADLNHTHPDIRGGWDYDVVWGLKAQKLFVDQLEQMYDTLEKTRTTNQGKWEYNWGWYAWILDRAHWNLPHMHEQFLGTEFSNIKLPPKINPDYTNWTWYENIFKYNGVDQFLTKNFADYERVKVAYGYVGYHAADYGGEWPAYYYGLTLAFKAYGIPTRILSGDVEGGRSEYPNIYISCSLWSTR